MLYRFDELDENAQANALYELWVGLMGHDNTEEWLSVLRSSLKANLDPLMG